MSKIYVDEIAPKTTGGLVKTPTKPIWFGRMATEQTITRGVNVKLTGFTTNKIDTANAFDGTTFTVPTGMAGIYSVTTTISCDFDAIGNDGEVAQGFIYVNGSSYVTLRFTNVTYRDMAFVPLTITTMVDLAEGDTVESYVYLVDDNGGNAGTNTAGTTFSGHFIG